MAVPNPELRKAMLRQFEEGTRLTDEYHLRIFPIWSTKTHHGNTAVLLSQTLALVAASQIRNNLSSEDLAAKQLQWVMGGNPFSQSLMYGEGYDYPPLYAYNPDDIVGSLPVGITALETTSLSGRARTMRHSRRYGLFRLAGFSGMLFTWGCRRRFRES